MVLRPDLGATIDRLLKTPFLSASFLQIPQVFLQLHRHERRGVPLQSEWSSAILGES